MSGVRDGAPSIHGAGADHDDGHDDHGETEVLSTVELTFTPEGGGEPLVAKFEDPDGDGGVSGTADSITLAASTTYSLRSVRGRREVS